MHKKYIGNPVVTGAKTSKMTRTTGVIMNSLSSLFDSYLPPESIEIVLEKQSSISVKAYGKSLGNISVAQFLKLIPPTHITLEIIKPNTSTLINIIGGSVHHLEETNIENGRNEDKIKISFTTSEMYSDVKDAVLNFKNCNLCTFPNVSLVDISSDEFSSGNNPSCVSDECQSVSESLSNIIAFSLNTKFRKTCYNMFENRNGTQTIRELIQFKLSDFENKKKPLRDSDDV